jgi:DNA-directed RNA polymerase specialized sigma24 family protein
MDASDALYPEDLRIAKDALSGDEASAGIFVRKYQQDIERYLVRRCHGNAMSIQKAIDIAGEVISDCFGATRRPRGEDILLKLYHGRTPLKVWLRTVAFCRLKSWWHSMESQMDPLPEERDESERRSSDGAPPKHQRLDIETVEILRIALENALGQIEPYQLLFLRLVHLHAVKQDHLARIWGCNPGTISRYMKAAAETINRLTCRYVKVLDAHLELQWSDFEAICAQYTSLLHGEAGESE